MVVVVIVYGGRESHWDEDVRSWKKVYGEERAERWEFLGMVEEGDFGEREMGDGELVGWGFFIWGFGGDCCGVYGLVVLLVEGFVLLFWFEVSAEAN